MNPILPIMLAAGIYYPGDKALDADRQDALKALSKVTAHEYELDKGIKRIEKRYIPQELKFYGGWTLFFGRLVVEKQVRYKWTF